jgi:hypothetical protein
VLPGESNALQFGIHPGADWWCWVTLGVWTSKALAGFVYFCCTIKCQSLASTFRHKVQLSKAA